MASRISDLMARAGGGNTEILTETPQDRMRFVQMAGVLLTTAGIATVSMIFALHNGVQAPLWASIVLGLAWGVIIFNLDRFLVLSMGDSRTRGWRLVGMMLPRFALAVLIAAVVSTPLVLRIFERDINKQLFVIQQTNSKQIASLVGHSADQQEANSLDNQIKTYQATLSGHLPQSIQNPQLQNEENQVQQLQQETRHDFNVATKAYERWQCELLGEHCLGSTRVPGNGAQARAKQRLYMNAHSAYEKTKSQLLAAQSTESKEQKQFNHYEKTRLAQLQATAKKNLPALERQYNALEKKIHGTISSGDTANTGDRGILAQLQALSAASAKDPSLEVAHWTVLALFFVIEILPVTVKALLNLGPPTTYEKLVIEREGTVSDREYIRRIEERRIEEYRSQTRIKEAQDRASLGELDSETQMTIEKSRSEARVNVADDMRRREEDMGKQANAYVAGEMTKIIDFALNEWGERIRTGLSADTGQSINGEVSESHTEAKSGYGLPDEGSL